MHEASTDSWCRPNSESLPNGVNRFCASGRDQVYHRLTGRNEREAVAASHPQATETMVNKTTPFRAVRVFLTLICQYRPMVDISPHP